MIDLPVHPLTYKTLLAELHRPELVVERKSAIWPVLTTRPASAHAPLTRTIRITGPRHLVMAVHDGAGQNLYELHMHQMIQYMCRRADLGHAVWPAMEEYYAAIDLDIDELAPETTYKRWQRYIRDREEEKKRENHLLFAEIGVLRKANAPGKGLNDALEYAAGLISAFPDLHVTFAGEPDRYMIQRAVMYAMHRHLRWRQHQIAEWFRVTRQDVAYHLQAYRALLPCHPAPKSAITGGLAPSEPARMPY